MSENAAVWDQYDWGGGGDEWSRQFGGTEALWSFVLYPRIQRFLPAQRILEIAPGYGRWTQFLLPLCDSLIGVDISENCVEHCRTRFAENRSARFFMNDGFSLAAVSDGSVDFAFSFDSLVHAEKDVIESYLFQLGVKLSADGVGFLHYSNLGAYPKRLALFGRYRRLPMRIRKHFLREDRLQRLLSVNMGGWRAPSMTANLFREYCERADLRFVSQELINWGTGSCLIDAFSVFTRKGSRWDTGFVCLNNDKFVESARLTRSLAELYKKRHRTPASQLPQGDSVGEP